MIGVVRYGKVRRARGRRSTSRRAARVPHVRLLTLEREKSALSHENGKLRAAVVRRSSHSEV